MENLSAKGRRRVVPSSSTAKLKTKVEGWIAKGGLSAVDLLSVEQAKPWLHTLDTKFKQYHMDVSDSLDNEGEIEREEAVMEEHEIRVAHIFVSLKSISSSSPSTSFETATTIKTESKELEVLRR